MLRAYLRHIGQSWREDDTNRVPNQARNHIRAKALPVLSQINPRVTDAFCRVAEAASADDQYIWSQLDALALPCVYPMPYGGSLPRGGLEQVPTPLLRRHLQRVFWALDLPPPEARHLLALEDIARQGRGSVPLNGGVAVRASQGFLHVMRPRAQAPVEWEMQLPAGGESKLWLGMRLFVREALPDETGDGGVRQVLRQEALTDAVIRTRRAGDQYAPAGMRGTQPFKQTLIDRKIDREFRSYLPVIARGDVILWAEGLPPAREAWLRGGEKGVFFALRGHAPWRLNK